MAAALRIPLKARFSTWASLPTTRPTNTIVKRSSAVDTALHESRDHHGDRMYPARRAGDDGHQRQVGRKPGNE